MKILDKEVDEYSDSFNINFVNEKGDRSISLECSER